MSSLFLCSSRLLYFAKFDSMFPKIATRLIGARQALNVALVRNIGSTSVVLSKLDPIQELYLQKVREYYKKKR